MLLLDKMTVKNLKIIATIFLTLLVTTYLTFAIASLWMLFVISFPSSVENENIMNRQISYAMFSGILIVSSICSISSFLYLYRENINLLFTIPMYIFLPFSIPYFLIQIKIKDNNKMDEIYDDSFSTFLLITTSIINYLLAISPLIFSITFLSIAKFESLILYFGIPLFIISLFMIIGTTANIFNYLHQSKVANRISYVGFTFVWVYKAYEASLIKNNLYKVKIKN